MNQVADIIIVGGGPSGLALALALAKLGKRAVLFEQRETQTSLNESRALTIMPGGLRFMQWLGLGDDILEHSRARTQHQFLAGRRLLAELDFSRLDGPFREVRDIRQPRVERILEKACLERDVIIKRGYRVSALMQSNDDVTVEVDGPEGSESYSALYGVAADGFHSDARQMLDIETTKRDYGTFSLVADFSTTADLGPDRSLINFDFQRPFGFFPFEKHAFRMVMRVEPGESRGLVTAPSFLLPHVQLNLGTLPDLQLLWASSFRLAQQQSKTYRQGRWLLLGDAAHAMGPSAGSGMQLGLLGAWRLAWRLCACLDAPNATSAVLDDYAKEQAVAADAVQQENAMIFRALAMRNPLYRGIRNVGLFLMGKIPPLTDRIVATAALEWPPLPTSGASDVPQVPGFRKIKRWEEWRTGAFLPSKGLRFAPTERTSVALVLSQDEIHSFPASEFFGDQVDASQPLGSSIRNLSGKAIAIVRPDQTVAALYRLTNV